MGVLISVDGELGPPERAKISVLDRGFLYGDSIYEVVRTYGGRPFALDAHLARMERSAEAIGLVLPPLAAIEAETRRVLGAAGNAESYVRVQVTRGAGDYGLFPGEGRPSVVVIVRPLEPPAAELYERGAIACVVRRRRNLPEALDPRAKTGNYLNNALALTEARAAGAYEALLCDRDGRLAEGATSNVFIVRGGEVRTPPLDIGLLDGVTRARVLALCGELGVKAREAVLRPEDLLAADEAFVTSTIRELVPVVEIRGAVQGRVGGGTPGPVTRRLHGAYRAAASREAR